MTSVVHLNHFNLNTGAKTGLEVVFADWLKVEKFVYHGKARIENVIEDFVTEIEWGPGVALVRVVHEVRLARSDRGGRSTHGSPVSVHAVAVNGEAADSIWRIIEREWMEEAELHPKLHTNNEEYPDIGNLKLPWVISLFSALWHNLRDDLRTRVYHHTQIIIGAVYRELRGRGAKG
jgi:hypothetical protein